MALVFTTVALDAAAEVVPDVLPDPDTTPPATDKPVKVYILAGQSNMVGMGDISGARNTYTGVFFTSNPAAPTGPMDIYRVGKYKIAPLAVYRTDGTPAVKPIARGQVEVPETGVYEVHCGSGERSCNVMELDGKQVYRRVAGGKPAKQDVTLQAGRRYAFTVSGFQGQPPRFWMQKTDLLGHGDLEAVAKREGKFPWLVDNEGNWTVRHDVYFQEARLAKDGRGSPLSVTSNNGKSIGPELGFGHVMGTYHDAQVLLIKTAQGNRSLGFDFRPPSSGRTDLDSKWESLEYKLMIKGVRETLDKIDKVVPGYRGQGYEIAGFVWWQGHKDSGTAQSIAEYEQNLVNLIDDVRKEFNVPKMPAVVATVGFGGRNMDETFLGILKAQMAVGDPAKHPEFAGTVASVDTRDFWREVDESPRAQGYHYNRNAETYMRVGDALGRAMVRLLGGKAEPLPPPPRPKRAPQQERRDLSEEEQAAAQAALAPIILDGIAPSYVANPRYNGALMREANGERPQRANQFLRGAMYGLVNCYRAAGIHDYDWHVFGPDLRDLKWDYYSFDPDETLPKDKGSRYRDVTYPEGMGKWFAPDFDVSEAGWKKGLPPFGSLGGKLEPLSESCTAPFCGCSTKPRTLWEKEVLLVRGTFDIPPLKEGHRYRIVVGGSCHVNAGEGYAIYVNGRLLAESKAGVGRRQGGQPRGAHIYNEFRDEFKGGTVTIAATSFLRYNHPRIKPYPPRGHLTLWLEEQKIPPAIEALAGDR
ncbi:MAG: sialate O-acetylesterase [Phycisphaerae bacterium]